MKSKAIRTWVVDIPLILAGSLAAATTVLANDAAGSAHAPRPEAFLVDGGPQAREPYENPSQRELDLQAAAAQPKKRIWITSADRKETAAHHGARSASARSGGQTRGDLSGGGK
jgi:hypothetical protein